MSTNIKPTSIPILTKKVIQKYNLQSHDKQLMKKFILSILLSFTFLSSTLAYKELIIRDYAGIPVRIIKVVLDSQHYVVNSIAFAGGETLEELTTKIGWNTSLNWAFFCPDDYSYCDGITHTISERVFRWVGDKISTYRWDTGMRWIFWFDKNWVPLFVQKNLGYMPGLDIDFNEDRIDDLFFGLGNFPVLLVNGSDVVERSESEIDGKMRWRWNKHFICSTKDKKTIYMWAVGGLTIYEMPAFLQKNFDCYIAINLDAWASASMIYDSKVLQRSSRRRIMDAFVVLDREQYIQLTKHTPPTTQPYNPPKYQLTDQDQKNIESVITVVHKFMNKNGREFKRKAISLFRKIISAPKYQDPQNQAVRHEILVRLFTIETI